MSVFIPMMPSIIFMIGVVGWLIQVVETVAAVMLWMAMHLTPEAEDSFMGSQKQGYLLLMGVFFRPVLMVLGLVASLAIFPPLFNYINWGFGLAMNVVQSESTTGVPSFMVLLAIYCFTISQVIYLVYGLPQTVPDRIMRFIGGGIADLGEQSTVSQIQGGASRAAGAALMHGLGNKVAEKPAGGGGGAGGSGEDKSDAGKQAEGFAGQSAAPVGGGGGGASPAGGGGGAPAGGGGGSARPAAQRQWSFGGMTISQTGSGKPFHRNDNIPPPPGTPAAAPAAPADSASASSSNTQAESLTGQSAAPDGPAPVKQSDNPD